jgi:hypothetical protein
MKNTTNQTLSDNSQFMLYSISNYKPSIEHSVSEILNKFVNILIEYMRFISEKIIMKNKKYYCFIFERGIETLIHVFSVIFYYTKNLNLTFYHTQKACYFYVEFIEQISDDNVTFLQLSSRDAILFVYKKTIFDINNEYKKGIQEPTEEENIILSKINSYICVYKSIVLFITKHNDFKYENKTNYINICCDSIKCISETLNKNKINPDIIRINCIYLFVTLLDDKLIEINDFFKLLDEFIKKTISKKKFDEKVIKNNIYDVEIQNLIDDNKLNKIVEWIFTY